MHVANYSTQRVTFIVIVVFVVTALLVPQCFARTDVTVEITNPNGGESYTAGSSVTITWDAHKDVDKVTLAYELSDTVHLIASNIPNEGSYDWAVDIGEVLPGTQKNVSINIIAYETGKGSTQDNSDMTFVVRSSEALPDGVVYDDESVIYGTELPMVKSKGVRNIVDTIAELYGTVDPNGLTADVWFEVFTAPNNPQDFEVPDPVVFPAVRERLDHLALITDLRPATTYSWRLVAENENEVVYGKTYEFTTEEASPTNDEDDADDDAGQITSGWVHTVTPTSAQQVARGFGAPYLEYFGVQAMLMKTHAADKTIILTAGSGSKLQKIAPTGKLWIDNVWQDISWNGIWPLDDDGYYVGKVYYMLRPDDELYREAGKYLAEMYLDLPGCTETACEVAGWRLQEYDL